MTYSTISFTKPEPRLIALLDSRVVGAVYQRTASRLHFVYDEEWQLGEASYPLSLSMPLTVTEHSHVAVNAYLWGLLPDNERTLDHYGRTFGVSARNPVALLAHIGADCAGAVQLVPPDTLHELLKQGSEDRVDWISDEEVARELRSAKETGLAGTDKKTVGRFSLAGAQPKIALFHRDGAWGRPLGRTPTTHILKPPSDQYAGFAENEHLCLDLASELGLGAARSAVQRFNDEIAIVVERFDRVSTKKGHRRIHQEDVCQALSVLPWNKYENDGGPGVPQIVSLIQESSLEPQIDLDRFIDILTLNWVLAAPDAHAKNYAILHVPGGGVRLAPFYDLASYLPYSDERLHEVKLAMRIGKEYLARRIAFRDWVNLATLARLPQEYVIGRVEALLQEVPKAIQVVANRAVEDGLDHRVIERLALRVRKRSDECIERLRIGMNAA